MVKPLMRVQTKSGGSLQWLFHQPSLPSWELRRLERGGVFFCSIPKEVTYYATAGKCSMSSGVSQYCIVPKIFSSD
jgi:hypothetical protein